MRWRIPLVVVLALFVAVSCDQKIVEPAADQVAEAPAFNFMNGPENPGESDVYRFKDYGTLSIIDFDQGLRVRLYDTFDTWRCGGAADDPIWDYQDVDGDRVKSVNQLQEVPLVVYPFPNTPGKDYCDFLAEDWLYRGTGVASVNDNNVFWFTGTGGQNSFITRARGTVEDRAGDLHNLNAISKVVVNGMCCFDWIPLEDEDYEEINVVEWIKIN
jgi:hypothetical protein